MVVSDHPLSVRTRAAASISGVLERKILQADVSMLVQLPGSPRAYLRASFVSRSSAGLLCEVLVMAGGLNEERYFQ